MGSGILNVSLTGLNAALSSIRTVQQNLANANTVGYHRQEAVQSAATPEYSGSGYFGRGVQMDTVRRVYDQFLSSQVQNYQTQLSRSEAYASYATQVDSLLGSSVTGLNLSMQKFFSSVAEVANDPTSLTSRQQMLSTSQSMASRFNLLSGNLQDIKSAINQDIIGSASQINTLADQIRGLNIQITSASSTGHTPNDMLDQREQLVTELGKLVNVSQIQQSDGSLTITIGQGVPLVAGTAVREVVAVSVPSDISQKTLAIKMSPSATPEIIPEASITSGRLSGLFAFRSEILNPSISDLDLMAQSLADAFNTQHQAGFDLNGSAGTAFFSYSATSQAGSLAVTVTQATAIAAAGEGVLTAAGGGNTGDASVGYATLSPTTARPLTNAPYTLTYDALSGSIEVTDSTAAVLGTFAYTSGTAISFNGISVTITDGTLGIADGDTFTIDNSGVSAGPGDNSNALALEDLQRQGIVGGATVAEYNRSMVGRNASFANTADYNVESFSALYKVSFDAEQAVSGVNLDEEAANLIRYQQAYQAAAKAIQTSSTMFDAILNAIQ